MTYNIELYSRFQSAFGFIAANALSQIESAYMRSNMSFYEKGDSTFADMIIKSSGGKEFVFKNPEAFPRNSNLRDAVAQQFNSNSDYQMEGVIAPPPMVTFSRVKNITKTVIDNSDFEVIENFGIKSWAIKIEGIVVDVKNHWYPIDLEKKIVDLFEINEILEIVGGLFANKNIHSIYTDSLEVSPVAGYNDTVKFTIQAYSIRPSEFLFQK